MNTDGTNECGYERMNHSDREMDLSIDGLSREENERLGQLSYRVIGALYEVSNVLGSGYLEKVYETR